MITSVQCRMARAAVGWNVRDLAKHAKVSASTVNRFEMGHVVPIPATLQAIQNALEAAGVEFIDDGGVRPGPKLRQGEAAP